MADNPMSSKSNQRLIAFSKHADEGGNMSLGYDGHLITIEALTEELTIVSRRAKALAEAIDFAIHEIGVPNEGYPANVANAYDRLFDAACKDINTT